jgi:DedD protein
MDRRLKERLIGATILVALIVLIVPELLSGPKTAPLPPLAADLPNSTRSVSVNLATSSAIPQPQSADAATETAVTESAAAPREAPGAPVAAGGRAVGSSGSGAGPGASKEGGAAPPGASAEASAPGTASMRANAGAAGVGTGAASSEWGAPTVATLKAQGSAAPVETPISSPRSALESAGAADAASAHGRRGWAVQLGSFASKANAEKLLHQLPGSGLYLVSSGSGASLRYRVRMGPLADRGAAERAVTKLKAAGHAATIVTPAS